MSLREIRIYGDNALRKKAKKVNKFDQKLKDLVKDMVETMIVEKGIGLAGPQVGVQRRVIVVDTSAGRDPDKLLALINPKIKWRSSKTCEMEEGCLSIPDINGTVERPIAIELEAQNTDGEDVRINARDMLARVIQHEVDHLEGILFTDKVVDDEQSRIEPKLEKLTQLVSSKT
jgi:peptide deformylase